MFLKAMASERVCFSHAYPMLADSRGYGDSRALVPRHIPCNLAGRSASESSHRTPRLERLYGNDSVLFMAAELISANDVAMTSEEASLIVSLRSGDAAAFEVTVRQYGGRMLTVARQLLGNADDAQDAVQDAFVTALRSLANFEGRSSLATWLHRIVVNAALMKLRSRRRRHEQPIEEFLPTYLEDGHQARPASRWGEAAAASLEQDETRQLVRQCIDRLPETHRTILLLRDIQELDTETVAGLLEISSDAVKVRLHRARQALRTLLDPVLGP